MVTFAQSLRDDIFLDIGTGSSTRSQLYQLHSIKLHGMGGYTIPTGRGAIFFFRLSWLTDRFLKPCWVSTVPNYFLPNLLNDFLSKESEDSSLSDSGSNLQKFHSIFSSNILTIFFLSSLVRTDFLTSVVWWRVTQFYHLMYYQIS